MIIYCAGHGSGWSYENPKENEPDNACIIKEKIIIALGAHRLGSYSTGNRLLKIIKARRDILC